MSTYPALKKANPDLPILIREAKGASARLFARFGEAYCSLFVVSEFISLSRL